MLFSVIFEPFVKLVLFNYIIGYIVLFNEMFNDDKVCNKQVSIHFPLTRLN